jgi:preprotein translocase subunit SecG
MQIGNYLLIILIFAVLAVLVAGVVLMGKGGKANFKYGNKLMMARVSLQGLVLVVLVMMYFFQTK